MKKTLAAFVVALALAAGLSGCVARGQKTDPFAYAKVPLFASRFDLASAGNESQQFRVEDGSIAMLRVQVWVNATVGGMEELQLVGPSGSVAWTTSSAGETSVPVDLGTWTVTVSAHPGSAGSVDVLVTRR
jgi:hypothetical protein